MYRLSGVIQEDENDSKNSIYSLVNLASKYCVENLNIKTVNLNVCVRKTCLSKLIITIIHEALEMPSPYKISENTEITGYAMWRKWGLPIASVLLETNEGSDFLEDDGKNGLNLLRGTVTLFRGKEVELNSSPCLWYKNRNICKHSYIF